MKTTDLCDQYLGEITIGKPVFRIFGGKIAFQGRVETVQCWNDNSKVKETLGKDGKGKVLVVDGGASLECALLGDLLGELAFKNGWQGIIVNGCIRDSEELKQISIGVRAIATHPKRSEKKETGSVGGVVEFAGLKFSPGDFIYVDADGIVLAKTDLLSNK